jgi:hypothetical protein
MRRPQNDEPVGLAVGSKRFDERSAAYSPAPYSARGGFLSGKFARRRGAPILIYVEFAAKHAA